MRRYKLHTAAGSSAQDLEALLGEGQYDVNLRDRNRCTPLHHAVYYNKAKCVKLLLGAGADVNATDRNGCSALHVACYIGALASVKALLKHGASVHATDERGHSCLHKAAYSGNERIVQVLVRSGASLSALDRAKRSALHVAALLGKSKALSVLLDAGLGLELRDANSCTALHCAASVNQVQSLQALLSSGAEVDARDWAGRTALHLAAGVGSEACAALLLAQDATVDALDDDRATPLHQAAFNGHADVLQVLLHHKANADHADSSNLTAFSKACFKGHQAVVELLLYDAKHRSMTLDHPPLRSGFIAAAAGGSIRIVDYLLEQNMDPDTTMEDGYSALTKAAFFGHLDIVKLLVEKYSASLQGPPLHAAAHAGHKEIVKYLLQAGCSASVRDDEQGTPLHSAAYSGHLACCELLIEAGADVSAKDARGKLPLHTAARNGHVDVLRMLLEVNAEAATVADQNGMQALHHAIGHLKCVELLIEKNVPLDSQDTKGSTPLHRAVTMNKVADAKALIKAGASLEIEDAKGKTPLHVDHSLKEELADVLAARARLGNIHQFERAVELFNEKPKKGIAFLREQGLVREGELAASDIGEFLATAKGLNLQQLGEYISEPGEESAAALHSFLGHFHFTGQTLEQAVRSYLVTFRLPGEAQRIDRVMQAFAARFHHDNPEMFSHEDTAYLLAFSMIMLQTDAHNPAIKREKKMTKQQFLQNNRKIDQGRDLPEAMLGEIYDNIITTPIKMETGMELSIEVAETTGMLRIRPEKGRWAKHWTVLRENCLYYHASEKDKQPQGIIPLENLAVRKVRSSPLQFEIVCGQATEGQLVKACKMESGMLVPDNVASFQFETSTEQEADQWCAKIGSSIIGNPVRELLSQRRHQQERATEQFSQSASSHLGPQLQIALHMCVAASKGDEVLLAEYPGALVRDPHGMLRYYVITNETAKSQFIVLTSHLWRDLDECESWEQSPTANRLLEICQLMRKNQKEAAANLSPLSGYPYRNMARKAFELLCDDLQPYHEYGLFVVAHGICGPVAPILARALLRQKFKVRKVLTFGQPAIFTERGAAKHAKLPYFRITHQSDIVPCLFQGYQHAGSEIMLFSDNAVTVVPKVERSEGKGLAVKVISTALSRARQVCIEVRAANAGPDERAQLSQSSTTSAGSSAPPSPMKTPLSPKSGGGSLKGGSLAHLMQRENQRPSFSSLHVLGAAVPAEEVEKVFQDLLWEENRITTYAQLLANPESKTVVLFDSKRNEL